MCQIPYFEILFLQPSIILFPSIWLFSYAPCLFGSEFLFFIFKLYKIVLVLPNIKMNLPQVYMCSWIVFTTPSWLDLSLFLQKQNKFLVAS